MNIGLVIGYAGKRVVIDMERIKTAEKLGFTTVWTSEAYGSDAVSSAAWILGQTEGIGVGTAIMQLPARSPACTAGTAISLNHLSGGRFVLGLGPSGPQVAEGWHGVPYGKPLARTREYVSIIREIVARERPLKHDGQHYQLPYSGPGATGLGKPLKSIVHAGGEFPIYTASISPLGLACAAEVADGVIPVWMNPERFDLFEKSLLSGFEKAEGRKTLADFDVAPFVSVVMGDDLEKCRVPVKEMLAMYIGGMGAKGKNFYNDYAIRLGYEEEAEKIQDLYLDGHKAAAIAAVPDQLVDDIALVGPADRIRDRLEAWKDAAAKGHVGSLLAAGPSVGAMEVLAESIL